MGTNGGTVKQGILVTLVFGQMLEHFLPGPPLAPTMEAHIDAMPVAEAGGKIAPGDSRPKTEQHGFDKQARVFGRTTDLPGATRQAQSL